MWVTVAPEGVFAHGAKQARTTTAWHCLQSPYFISKDQQCMKRGLILEQHLASGSGMWMTPGRKCLPGPDEQNKLSSTLSLLLPFQSGQPVNLNCIHLKLNLNMERECSYLYVD